MIIIPMKELPFIVFGAGGHAACVIAAAIEGGKQPDAVVDDAPGVMHEVLGAPVFSASGFHFPSEFRFIVAVGNCRIRRAKYRWLESIGGTPESVVHPKSNVSRFACFGRGSVILAFSSVDPRARVGNNSIINVGALVGHDCIIEDDVHVSANVVLGGNVRIGPGAWVGLGAIVKECVTVGESAFIGLGAMISHNVPAHARAISPHKREAHILRQTPSHDFDL